MSSNPLRHWYILDAEHRPVPAPSLEAAFRFRLDDPAACVVGRTVFARCTVSTVFLFLDQNFGIGEPPLLFETMVFGGALDGLQTRCATWPEAEAMHAATVAMVRAAGERNRASGNAHQRRTARRQSENQ